MKKININIKLVALLVMLLNASLFAKAQRTYEDVDKLTVNENISTFITASEPIMLVDVSSDSVAADRPLDNVIRVKPKTSNHHDGEVLGVVTIITERYRVQYSLVYTSRAEEAVTDKEVELVERNAFHNPEVSMSTADMAAYAMKVWNLPAHYHSTFSTKYKITMRLNNVYVLGDYFFIDFSVDNATNLPFDIDQLRVKLVDKKTEKATNIQTIEVKPAFILDRSTGFKRSYRNVIVIKKMTFPDDKVLSIELSEKQISGRTIGINVDYQDILSADSFDNLLLK